LSWTSCGGVWARPKIANATAKVADHARNLSQYAMRRR